MNVLLSASFYKKTKTMRGVVWCGAVSGCYAVAWYRVVWCRVEWDHQAKGKGVNNTTGRSEGTSKTTRNEGTQGNGDNRTTSKNDGNAAQEDMKLPHHGIRWNDAHIRNKRRLKLVKTSKTLKTLTSLSTHVIIIIIINIMSTITFTNIIWRRCNFRVGVRESCKSFQKFQKFLMFFYTSYNPGFKTF